MADADHEMSDFYVDEEEQLEAEQHHAQTLLEEQAQKLRTFGTNATSVVDADAREEALKEEIRRVREVNDVIETLVNSMEISQGNMQHIHHTILNANSLLSIWQSTLSQTEHTQRILQSESWHGSTSEAEELAAEAAARQLNIQRRLEAAREKGAQREREVAAEEARRAVVEAQKAVAGARGRGTGTRRGATRGAAAAATRTGSVYGTRSGSATASTRETRSMRGGTVRGSYGVARGTRGGVGRGASS
ncbi:DASH complex subunit Duo1-domain-containing protein [Pyronema domesticum]|uniref:DASH complex subunit DUO1 n=1 Tax=Pyronema omphalodes (strain CBS 100304) TaxID=1076935 RepID=U4LJE8_PYROM|nr:DASH complex subunit Duo1-domain-containing protein [Pyronema domesticum]CCX32214.1 Similar to DASH complex subunit duo1; acc. no. O74372 [Pyronema omphalodes CBS 100304]